MGAGYYWRSENRIAYAKEYKPKYLDKTFRTLDLRVSNTVGHEDESLCP